MISTFLAPQAGQKAFKNREKGNPQKSNMLERQEGLVPTAEVRKGFILGADFQDVFWGTVGPRRPGCILREQSFLFLNQ